MRNSKNPYMIERLVAAGTYVSMGMVGFAWLIICAIGKYNLRPFLKYHIFQCFFLVMGYFLLTIFTGLIVSILGYIPFINILVYKILFLFTVPMIFGFSIIKVVVLIAIVYLALSSLQGRYTYIPWVSNIIDSSVRRDRY